MKKCVFLFLMWTAAILLQAQVRRTPVQQQRTTQTTAKTFTLANGKLGPIQTGVRFANIPATYAGLYDKYTYKKIEHESDMEDDWTEEYYQFTKAGKNVFRVGVDESKKITGITLQEGSTSIVKTSEGFYVGYPARTLFTKKPMQWSTYFEGTPFAMSGHWTYAVLDSDLNNTDIPYKVSDLKPTAKLYTISYSHEIYEEYGY